MRNEAGAYLDWSIVRDLAPIARKLYGLLENDRFERDDDSGEWQAYWLGPPLFASVGSTCARDRDNVAAVWRACEAIAMQDPRYRFERERVVVDGRTRMQLLVTRSSPPLRANVLRSGRQPRLSTSA